MCVYAETLQLVLNEDGKRPSAKVVYAKSNCPTTVLSKQLCATKLWKGWPASSIALRPAKRELDWCMPPTHIPHTVRRPYKAGASSPMLAGADQTVKVQCNMLLSSVHSKGQHHSDSLFHIFPSPDQLKHQAPPAPPWLENCWVWALVHNNADKDGVVFQVPIGLVLQHSVGDKKWASTRHIHLWSRSLETGWVWIWLEMIRQVPLLWGLIQQG